MTAPIMEFLATGLIAFETLAPDEQALWRRELFHELGQRGGLTDDGKHVVKATASELFSEVVERGTRIFAKELIERTREYTSETEIERLEVEMGNSLRRVLDRIASKWS
jgi:hypothetical protein